MLVKLKKAKILGFTAVEITMVATVIAILALLILPMFRKRTEEAKKAAANDDLQSMMKAMILANADTDQWFRLQDLDNPQIYNDPPEDNGNETPLAYWNRAISPSERLNLSSPDRWQGPYVAYSKGPKRNFWYYSDLYGAGGAANGWKPFLFSSEGGAIFNGPYLLSDTSGRTYPSDYDKLPKDPWGNPYIFFGPGKVGYGPQDSLTQTNWGHAVIYCLGPNGFPGDNEAGAQQAASYFRIPGPPDDTNLIGNGDDMFVIF